MLKPAFEAAEELDATVVNMRFVKPLDAALVRKLAQEHELLVTVEEGAAMGGAGSAVAECLAAAGLAPALLHLGLPDRFVDHGDTGVLLAEVGLDKPGLLAAIKARLAT
jgi:1-deoxy-D-xylulose-5-phosphate synthase